MSTRSERSWFGLAAGLAVAMSVAFGACGDLGEALLEEECFAEDDCGPLNCIKATGAVGDPLVITNSAQLGWCLESGTSCLIGEQPFCGCADDPASDQPLCQSPSTGNRTVTGTQPCWDGTNLASCVCLPTMITCPYDEEGM